MTDNADSTGIRPVVLIVMDGYGCNPEARGNAIAAAKRPVLSHLWDTCPRTELKASGLAVGLPEGQMGNSEVGHLNLGAGKVVYQDFTKISRAIDDGTFGQNPELRAAMQHVKDKGSSLHVMGLIGRGGVHAYATHLYAVMEMAKAEGVDRVFIHAITDGRDTKPTDGLGAAREVEEQIRRIGVGDIATVSGRYYAMDRDRRWDRTARAYNAMVHGQGPTASSAQEAIQRSYDEGVTDEFILPTVIVRPDGNPAALIKDHDAAVFFNFRTDRPRQLVRAFVMPDFAEFDRGPALLDLYFVTMTQYEKDTPVHVAFRTEDVSMPLARVLADRGLKQLHAAETEKYAHVTFFFNGGREAPMEGEDRILIPSPREVGTYDKKPEMSGPQIAEETARAIETGAYDFVLVNFANADMVGHTGVMEAAIEAVETVDRCVGQIVDAATGQGGVVLITADHGNAEQMIDYNTGGPYTAHTVYFPVPFVLVAGNHRELAHARLREGGVLADVAPTILGLMGIPQPSDMEGSMLIQNGAEKESQA
ncbi:MAG: 2,3-bisphosphoglycerate-independent phosphoglycerate mutase [Chloroflexi bacterium]|nr:2,3-bisphosphoglycerate-independent phosphoglycerate mutase [Chloroflexota bacterium]